MRGRLHWSTPIFGLNWRDQRAPAVDWLEKLGDPYIATAYDEDGRVGIDWGVYGAPETFLIGADGTVIYKHISPLNEQVWQQEFLPRIRAARSEAR
jgi:cytochrome c biogenesis protein CcmG, thiol:disulfide interchange protein DsbE